MKVQQSDKLASLVVEVIDDRLHPGIVGVAWVINVATVHLHATADRRKNCHAQGRNGKVMESAISCFLISILIYDA